MVVHLRVLSDACGDSRHPHRSDQRRLLCACRRRMRRSRPRHPSPTGAWAKPRSRAFHNWSCGTQSAAPNQWALRTVPRAVPSPPAPAMRETVPPQPGHFVARPVRLACAGYPRACSSDAPWTPSRTGRTGTRPQRTVSRRDRLEPDVRWPTLAWPAAHPERHRYSTSRT